jgi:hypothetical protein
MPAINEPIWDGKYDATGCGGAAPRWNTPAAWLQERAWGVRILRLVPGAFIGYTLSLEG